MVISAEIAMAAATNRLKSARMEYDPLTWKLAPLLHEAAQAEFLESAVRDSIGSQNGKFLHRGEILAECRIVLAASLRATS